MPQIFISYRRDDCAGHAGRLYDRLRDHFGPDEIFRDIDTIEPGQDFVEVIENAVGSCRALVVLIGKHWATIQDHAGRRRLDNPEDWVRLEVAAALRRKILVIPVLLQGASVPASTELPEPLAKLSRINALEISDTRWDYDVGRLLDTLDKTLTHASPAASSPAAPDRAGTGDGSPPALPAYPLQPPTAPPVIGRPLPPAPALLTPVDFVGRWRFEDSAVIKSFIDAEFLPNGACHGVQTAVAMGVTLNFTGQWAYLPAGQMLQVQGLIGGFQPFSFALMIQGVSPAGMHGVGADGLIYSLQRAG